MVGPFAAHQGATISFDAVVQRDAQSLARTLPGAVLGDETVFVPVPGHPDALIKVEFVSNFSLSAIRKVF